MVTLMRIVKKLIRKINFLLCVNKEASISIMSAILVPAIVFISIGIADASKVINEQVKIDRFMNLYGDQILANYDRSLFERYGLYGFEKDYQLDAIVNEHLQNENIKQEITSEVDESLYLTDVLNTQVNSFSASRVPVRVFNEIKSRIESLPLNNKIKPFEKLKATASKINSVLERIGLGEISNELAPTNSFTKNSLIVRRVSNINYSNKRHFNFEDKLINNSQIKEEDNDETKKYIESNLNEIDIGNTETQEQAVSIWQDFLKNLNYAKNINAEINATNESKANKGFLLSVIDNLEKVYELTKTDFIAPLEKLMLIEYTVNQFNSHVRGPNTADSEFITLTGHSMSTQEFKQTHEAEQILLALESPNLAMGIMNSLIYSTRLLSNYYSIYNTPSKMASKRTIATGISAAIVILSLGIVVIDVESITQVLVLLDSVFKSYTDLKKLKNGESLSFIEVANSKLSEIKISYIDYLRFIGIFRSSEKQYFLMAKMIKSNMGKDYFTRINFTCDYSNKYWSYLRKSESKYDFEKRMER